MYLVRQAWTSRIVPLFVCMVVAGCIWYALSSRPKAIVLVPTTSHTPSQPVAKTHASTIPIADIAPVVNVVDGHVHFSIDTKPHQQIQKVEFYVENKFIGAAFAQPFSVRMSENDLSAGTHTVIAKVFSATLAAQTTPALFTANPSTPPAPHLQEPEQPATQTNSTSSTGKPAATPTMAHPADLVIALGDDKASAQLSWSAVTGAASYQIWRDGTLVGTSANLTYSDGNLTSGQTYDYKLIAVDSNSNTSAPSEQVAFTVPVPKPAGSSQSNTSQSPDQNQQPASTSDTS